MQNDTSATKRVRRGPSATAFGFLAAFGLSVATIIYTGLKVGAPRDAESQTSRPVEAPRPSATITAGAAGAAADRPERPAGDEASAAGSEADGAQPPVQPQ